MAVPVIWLALALLALAAPADARWRCSTGQDSLELRKQLNTDLPPIPIPERYMQTMRYVNQTAGSLCWLSFTWDGETWPRDRYLYLVVGDREVRDSVLLVSEPKETLTMRPYLLRQFQGFGTGDLWRTPCPWGGQCTMVLAGFPWHSLPKRFSVSDVTGVRAGRETSATPHTAKGAGR